ncbi:hypothetical protein VTO42DRAFT_4737 [Malbranchea cinnamomea]
MSSFYSSALNALPPTPPHVNMVGRMETDPSFYASNHSTVYSMRFGANTGDFVDKYSQPPCYPNQVSMPHHPQSLRPSQSGRDLLSSHIGHQASYGHVSTANMLPPIRASTKLPPMDSAIPPQYRRQETTVKQDQRPKEEKSTGGVAAHLDYEMDQMADFVAEMAQGIIYPGTTVSPQFRKYVLQILSSTRLPSSTILLGLYYLAARVRMLSAAEVYASGSAQLCRMLTIALVLGSKFLDDNTFQNRSWSEVSNIPVAELNAMELEWLFAFEWKIHERIHDKQDGFMTWRAHWETWRAKANARAHESRVKLSPIDTNIPRRHIVHTPMLSPDGPIPPQYQSSTWLAPLSSDYSPPSAPNSGPNTPDYYQPAPWAYNNLPPPYSRNWGVPPPYSQAVPSSQPPSYHHTPVYHQALSPPVWTGHGSGCGCLYCAKHQENYLPSLPFGLQPVAG